MADKGGLTYLPNATEANVAYEEALKRLTESLDARKNRLFDPTLLAMAEGFLGPTQTGSFAESLGKAVGKYRGAVLEEEKTAQEIAKAQMGLAQQRMEIERQKKKQEMMQGLFAGPSQELSSQQILALSQLDPNMAKLALDIQKSAPEMEQFRSGRELREIQTKLFKPTQDGKLELDPLAYSQYVSKGGPDASKKVAEAIKANRDAGLMSNLKAEGPTPFDAVILFSKELPGTGGQAWSKQAQQLSKQYTQGILSVDRANQLAKDMMQGIQGTLDRQSSIAATQMHRETMAELARGSQRLQQDRLEDKRQAESARLTDEQKNVLKTYVNPIVQEGIKGQSALMTVQSLRDIIEKAPSGTLSGVYAMSVGRLFGTDDNTALRRLETASKSLIPQIPRLPGAASNLDSQNLELSIGKLSDPTLTNEQRREVVNDIYTRFKRLVDRADRVNDYWESNKAFTPKLLEDEAKPMPTGEKMKAYADQYFGSDQDAAKRYLQTQGYR